MPVALPTEEVDAALKKSAAQYEDWVKSLEEQKRRLAYLQAVEKQFLATRDMDLLEEFKDRRCRNKHNWCGNWQHFRKQD